MITQQIQNELQTVINRSLPYAAYMYWCNVPIRDGQLGLIRQITWHQNFNTAVSGFYHDRAFWSLLGDTAMLEWWIRLFMLRVTCVCQNIDGVVWWTLLIGVVVSTMIRFLIRSSTHISGWLHITVLDIYAMLSFSDAQNSVFNEEVAYFWTFKNDQISVIVDIHKTYSISNISSNYGDIAKIHSYDNFKTIQNLLHIASIYTVNVWIRHLTYDIM